MVEYFGIMPSGEPVKRICLECDGMQVWVLSLGATIQEVRIPNHDLSLVLGFNTLEPYLQRPGNFGTIVGRVANRIAHGRFKLEGKAYQLDKNLNDTHTLHGGFNNIGERNWTITEFGPDFVRLEITDPDGQAGFPGNCKISCIYKLTADNTLEIELSASCDQTTLCNLAHHSYFNLDGSTNILNHQLQLAASQYLPVDNGLIPTGEIKPVVDTRFDFQEPRSIKTPGVSIENCQLDHNFCLPKEKVAVREIGKLTSKQSNIELHILSDQPGLQVYTGGHIVPNAPGINGKPYEKNAGIAFEPQHWPDAPNQPNFPSIVLPKGDIYRQHSAFRFTNISDQ